MKLIEQKLKVIDIDYHDDVRCSPSLFFDVIEHYFEDQFLVIKYYKEYGDGSAREEITYIPSVNISKFVIYLDEQCYNERNDQMKYLKGINNV